MICRYPKIPKNPSANFIVTIPAKNEQRSIGETLSALFGQIGFSGDPLPTGEFEIILLADGCTDETADIARSLGIGSPFPLHVIETDPEERSSGVGAARRMLMDMAAEMLASGSSSDALIATTDADTKVAPDWVVQTRAALTPEVAAVAGLVEVDFKSAEPGDPAIASYQQRYETYERMRCELAARLEPIPHEPGSRHSINTGASFAVRADVYRKTGRMPALRTGEDIAFYRKLLTDGHLVRHSRDVKVHTSGRETGRVSGGLADALGGWRSCVETGGAYLVESPGVLAEYYKIRARIREVFFPGDDIVQLVSKLGLRCFTERDVRCLLSENPPLELFMEEIELARGSGGLVQPVAYEDAVREMRMLVDPSLF